MATMTFTDREPVISLERGMYQINAGDFGTSIVFTQYDTGQPGRIIAAPAHGRSNADIVKLIAEHNAQGDQPGTVTERAGETRSAFCARRIAAAISLAFDGEDDPETLLRDTLTDLRHYATSQGLDWHDAADAAYGAYLDELHDAPPR